MMSQHTLKFAPSILARLGEELLPNFDQGIIELVRNAYDADARTCTVTLENITEPGGSIIIHDTGQGMDENKIASAWLVLGHSSKRGAATTPAGRIQVGDKGLGRLAALRMGHYVILESRPALHHHDIRDKNPSTLESSANQKNRVDIDWCMFDACTTVDEVQLKVESKTLEQLEPAGTTIHIKNLKNRISKYDVGRLARNLMLLANPFAEANDFQLFFECKDYPEFERLVQEGYLSESEYKLEASLDEQGIAKAVVYDWKGDIEWETTSSDWFTKKEEANPVYGAPPSKFELSIFQLEKKKFTPKNINVSNVKEWLQAVGGVHVYQNKFRVHPYGDPGTDWLDMNLSRVNQPIRPSTNTSIGKVEITDPDKLLQQKTDRIGFIENEAFHELKRFVKDALNWYARKRIAEVDKRKRNEQSQDALDEKEKQKELDSSINKIKDQETKKAVKSALKAARSATKKHAEHLKEDLKLYRSLATAGTTTAVFSHEVSKPLDEIPILIHSTDSLIKKQNDEALYNGYVRRANLILGYLDRLSHFAKLQLNLLKKSKRRDGVINVNETLTELVDNFRPLLNREYIVFEFEIDMGTDARLHGSDCILEAIITNCFTNSMRAFQKTGFQVEERQLHLVVTVKDKKLIIAVHDNGPGIVDISLDEIWLPGFTTNTNGTGFGLTIVKDSVSDLGGNHHVEAHGPLGGASFYFEFSLL